jgi:uncharacterized MAPEG superfamily protein
MSATACAILGLASWYVATLLALATFRVYTTAAKKKPANTFATDGSDVPGLGQRLTRVHANCYENIPVFMGVMLLALATGQTAITDPSACMLVYARIGQSVVHAASTSIPAVMLRFALFFLQVLILICWLWQIAFPAAA